MRFTEKQKGKPQLKCCEIIGSLLGILAGILIVIDAGYVHWTFLIFLLSNIVFLPFAIANKMNSFLLLEICFIAINVLGIYNTYNNWLN